MQPHNNTPVLVYFHSCFLRYLQQYVRQKETGDTQGDIEAKTKKEIIDVHRFASRDRMRKKKKFVKLFAFF